MTKTADTYFPKGEIEGTLINSIWRLSDDDTNIRKEVILPKGTVEIIFNFSDKINYYNPSLEIETRLPSVFINGVNFKPFELTKTGHQEFVGIQMNSVGLKLLFNVSVAEINDRVYKGESICPDLGILSDKLFCCSTFSEQYGILLAWIRSKLSAYKELYSIHRARRLLELKNIHNATVKKVCKQLCLSDRQLRRFSIDWVGMNTEDFIQYNKYLRSLHLLHNSQFSLTDIGLIAGYYDQSHFIREFKAYTNMTPGQYRDKNAEYPGHISLD